MTDPTSALDDIAFVDALLDLLIPPSSDMPGAGSLGLSHGVAASVRADPMLSAMIEAGASALREAALAVHRDGLPALALDVARGLLSVQASANPFLAIGLMRHLCPLYYQDPGVLKRIGAEARPPFPGGFVVEATDPALMQTLLARRKTP